MCLQIVKSVNIYKSMKSIAIYSCFFLTVFISAALIAQQPPAPTQLSASYQKYTNRIELSWQGAADVHHYNIYRSEQTKKRFELIDSVNQNRFVDRKSLKYYTSYIYHVRAIANNSVSDMSNEATGALLAIANKHDTSLSTTTPPLKDCLDITLTQTRFVSDNFIARYSVTVKSEALQSVQLTLYRSNDSILDEQDNFLTQETLSLPSTKGAIISKNNGEPTKGFLILKIATEVDSFVVARKIE